MRIQTLLDTVYRVQADCALSMLLWDVVDKSALHNCVLLLIKKIGPQSSYNHVS